MILRTIILFLLLTPLNLFSQDWLTFTDTAGMYTASYPAGWTNKIKTGNRVFFTSPAENEDADFRQNININVTIDPEYGTRLKINDVTTSVIESVEKGFLDFELESTRFFKWNSVDACEIIYTGKPKSDEDLKVRVKQRMCFYKTRLYLVTYVALSAEDSYSETALKIMDRIRFKP